MKTLFEHNEAEQMVKELRAHLRVAEGQETLDNAGCAQIARSKSDAILVQVLERLAPRIDRYADACFSGKNAIALAETRQDARREMVFQLCRRLRDLRDKPGAKYFETKFNAAVKCCFLDAIRRVHREQDLNEEGYVTSSLDETLSIDESVGVGETLVDTIECHEATRAMNKILGDDMAADFLEQLTQQTSVKHAKVFCLRIENLTWDEIAQKVGISDRTARTYYGTAVSLLRRFSGNE